MRPTLHIREADGPTVVFVHGTPCGVHALSDAFDALPDHRVAALDHLGFGTSVKPPTADYGLAAHQRRFASVADTLVGDRAVFVLHDFGASIAAPWMLENPHRVAGVVVTNTFLWPATGGAARVARAFDTTIGRWLYRRFQIPVQHLLPMAWGTHRPLTPDVHERYHAPFPNPADRHALSAMPGNLVGPELTALADEAERFAQWPVELVWGLADPLVGAEELARWQRLLPDAQLTTRDDVGHFVVDEWPDGVVRAVRSLTHRPAPGDPRERAAHGPADDARPTGVRGGPASPPR